MLPLPDGAEGCLARLLPHGQRHEVHKPPVLCRRRGAKEVVIPCLLDGSESGKYLGLDLGGTNFRVLLITLEKGRIMDEVISYYTVAEHLRLGPGENLFHFLAECILDFLTVQNLPLSQKFNLGFTFSFPMTQQGLDVGLLVK